MYFLSTTFPNAPTHPLYFLTSPLNTNWLDLIDLNWRPHINTISKTISAGLATLKRVSHFIPFDTKVNMYKTLVMPYFNYCSAVWVNINKGLADKFQKNQNRAAGILTFSTYEVCSIVLLDELGWERLEYVKLKQLALTMYKIYNDLSPSYLRWIFTNTSNIHSHNRRAYTTEDLLRGTRFLQRLETCLV